MGKVSRRAALTAGAVIPFSQWLGSQAWAQGVHIRRDLSTPVGNTDLLKYQHGVQLMKQRAETDPKRGVQLLSRAQTEEWKGWMQFAFIMYHYYRMYSAYNEIRCFVSAYVW